MKLARFGLGTFLDVCASGRELCVMTIRRARLGLGRLSRKQHARGDKRVAALAAQGALVVL
eukprot:scaffold109441_cov23-Tisochrysis_lutea.AAC.2